MSRAHRTETSADQTPSPLRLGMEALWLTAAVAVPLVLAPPDVMVVFHYVPKVTLLRTLATLMAVLWLIEWAWSSRPGVRFQGRATWASLVARLPRGPRRWMLGAACLYLVVNIFSAVLAVSRSTSLWGYFPGRDSYGLYTVSSYVVIFFTIVTHLKTPAQTWRLLAAVVAAGVVAASYGVLQYLHLDPWGVGREGGARIESTFGNAVFAGAFFTMTIPISLALCMMVGSRRRALLTILLWGAAVGVQLLALLLTLSRGPWVGLAIGLFLFFALAGLALERRLVLRVVVSLAVPLVLALPFAVAYSVAPRGEEAPPGAEIVLKRLASIYPEVVEGGFSDRVEVWKASSRLALRHPWFAFDSLSLASLRPLVGYGPDLFQAVSHLELPTTISGSGQVWQEVNHAHNYLLHHWVELGFLGLLSFVALLAAAFVAGPVQLLRNRSTYSSQHKLLLVAVSAALGGRLVEQMVGVAQVGDMALLWVLLAVLTALPIAMAAPQPAPRQERTRPSPRRLVEGLPGRSVKWRWALVAPLIAALAWLLWVKNVNYAWADMVAASAERSFRQGRLEEGIRRLQRATDLAPDVTFYYQRQAAAYDALRSEAAETPARVGFARAAYEANLKAFQANPLARDVRFDLAHSTLVLAQLGVLGRATEATQRYEELVTMLSGSWAVQYNLGVAYMLAGQPREALARAETLKNLTQIPHVQAKAFFLQGGAYLDLGEREQAAAALERNLELDAKGEDAAEAHRALADLYRKLGDEKRAEEHDRIYQALTSSNGP